VPDITQDPAEDIDGRADDLPDYVRRRRRKAGLLSDTYYTNREKAARKNAKEETPVCDLSGKDCKADVDDEDADSQKVKIRVCGRDMYNYRSGK
jgi:hypothetical protein